MAQITTRMDTNNLYAVYIKLNCFLNIVKTTLLTSLKLAYHKILNYLCEAVGQLRAEADNIGVMRLVSDFVHQKFWVHSLNVSQWCRMLANDLSLLPPLQGGSRNA